MTARAGGWLAVDRLWQPGDVLEVTLPMRLALAAAPDDRAVRAAAYGPIVLAGAYGTGKPATMPRLRAGSLTPAGPLTFSAKADGKDVTLRPVARTHHQHYNVYWKTA